MEVVALFASVFCCTESLLKVDVDGSCKEIMDMIGNLQFLCSY